jgi:hypothetical protein
MHLPKLISLLAQHTFSVFVPRDHSVRHAVSGPFVWYLVGVKLVQVDLRVVELCLDLVLVLGRDYRHVAVEIGSGADRRELHVLADKSQGLLSVAYLVKWVVQVQSSFIIRENNSFVGYLENDHFERLGIDVFLVVIEFNGHICKTAQIDARFALTCKF